MQNPLTRFAEALSAAGEQSPETRTRQGATSYHAGRVDEVPAPEDLADEYRFYRETPFINAALGQFAADVTEPGARVEADADETEQWFNDDFLPQAGIVAGERNQPFDTILFQSVIQHEAAGNILVEKVKADPTADDPTYTGFMHIRPESIRLVTEDNRPILVDAEGDAEADVETTDRGEPAAYLQYHNESILGRRQNGQYYADRDVIALSTNDVIKVARNPVPGNVWGESVIHPVADLVRGLKQILRDNEAAIQTKAYGIWSVAFGREVLDLPGGQNELIEWGEDEQSDFINNKIGRDLDPGDIIGHDGAIDFEKFEGEVADGLIPLIELYVKLIVTALPTPLYAVGIETDINQFVTAQQEPRYEKRVAEMRETLADAFEPALVEIAEQQDLPTEGLRLRIEPESDESPLFSLDESDMERLTQFTSSLKDVYGPGGAPSYLDEETLAELVLQLPDDALVDEVVDELDLSESNPEVQAQFEQTQGQGQGEQAATDGGTDETE
jgi:hypothetical protein